MSDKRIELHLHTEFSYPDSETSLDAYLKKAADDRQPAMAVTDFLSVGALSERTSWKPGTVRLIPGLECQMENGGRTFHVTALARNHEGMIILRALSQTKLVAKQDLNQMRKDILIGSACDEGELYQALLSGKTEEELRVLAAFYDYIEIQPPDNFRFLIDAGSVQGERELVRNVEKLARLGRETGVPVVAVGDVCIKNKEDVPLREALLKKAGIEGAYAKAPLYFRTTQEMLAELSFLEPNTRRETVVTNPNRIADLCKV